MYFAKGATSFVDDFPNGISLALGDRVAARALDSLRTSEWNAHRAYWAGYLAALRTALTGR